MWPSPKALLSPRATKYIPFGTVPLPPKRSMDGLQPYVPGASAGWVQLRPCTANPPPPLSELWAINAQTADTKVCSCIAFLIDMCSYILLSVKLRSHIVLYLTPLLADYTAT